MFGLTNQGRTVSSLPTPLLVKYHPLELIYAFDVVSQLYAHHFAILLTRFVSSIAIAETLHENTIGCSLTLSNRALPHNKLCMGLPVTVSPHRATPGTSPLIQTGDGELLELVLSLGVGGEEVLCPLVRVRLQCFHRFSFSNSVDVLITFFTQV